MAASNFSALPTLSNLSHSVINDHLRTIKSEIQGSTGFLFAAKQPDGSLRWFAGGGLDRYDVDTQRAAMDLYVESIRFFISAR